MFYNKKIHINIIMCFKIIQLSNVSLTLIILITGWGELGYYLCVVTYDLSSWDAYTHARGRGFHARGAVGATMVESERSTPERKSPRQASTVRLTYSPSTVFKTLCLKV